MEDRQLALRVEVDQPRVDQELRKAARKVAGQYRIPGFRQGKAPYSVIVQYVGLPALFNEFLEDLGQELYRQAIEEAKVEPYAMAALDIDSLEPLTYKYIVPLEPEIDLGDYRSLRVEEAQAEVTEEEIEEQLQEYREQYTSYGEVDRPGEYGDMLTVDVKSVLLPEAGGEETIEQVVLDETDWDITLDKENPLEPPGLDEALLGLRPGEEKEFVLSWPADSQSIYAGKQARFHVKVQKIQADSAPALDDDFAQMVGPDFKTLDDLKANIRETLLEAKQSDEDNEYLTKALDALVAQSTLVYPPVVVEDQIDVMVNEFERQLRNYGMGSLEDYLRQIGQSTEQYRDSIREQAETIARRNLVISELYRKEGIGVSDEEIEQRVNTMVGADEEEATDSARALRDMMRSGAGRSILESQILQEKALERLLAIVRGEEIPEPSAPQPESAQAEAASTESPAAEATAASEAVQANATDDEAAAEDETPAPESQSETAA
jgi:trigger factor